MHADHSMWGDRLTKATIQETNRHHDLVDGPTVAELAEQRGVDPMDLMIDLALEDDLATRYRIVLANDDEVELAGLLQDERTVLGLSDAGAHASQLCDANFSTHLLGEWVRERGVLTPGAGRVAAQRAGGRGVPPGGPGPHRGGRRRRPGGLRPGHRRLRAPGAGLGPARRAPTA